MILFIVNMVAAAVVFVSGLFFVIKNMNFYTKASIRFAWIFMTLGAFGVLAAPLFNAHMPSGAETILMVGVAVFIVCERRNRQIWCRWPDK